MGEIKTGGPAFPHDNQELGDKHRIAQPGMALRDWFAGQALAGLMAQSHAGPKDWQVMGHGWGEDCANSLNKHEKHAAMTLAGFAYALADALLRAREGDSNG